MVEIKLWVVNRSQKVNSRGAVNVKEQVRCQKCER